MLKIDFFFQKIWVYYKVIFDGLGVQKMPDALLARAMILMMVYCSGNNANDCYEASSTFLFCKQAVAAPTKYPVGPLLKMIKLTPATPYMNKLSSK